MFNAAIIGLGRIGAEFPDNHVKAYQDAPECELVAVCDTDISKAGLVQFVPFYASHMLMLAEQDIDIVSICTPPETHRDLVRRVVPFVKGIYCEKPIATTLEDADDMIRVCKDFGVVLQVNHQRRFVNPKFRFSRGMLNTGTHAFDLMRQLFGDVELITEGRIFLKHGIVDIEYVDTQEPIFELDCTRSKEPMIGEGVNHLVDCIKYDIPSISSGEEARETLRCVLEYGRLIGNL